MKKSLKMEMIFGKETISKTKKTEIKLTPKLMMTPKRENSSELKTHSKWRHILCLHYNLWRTSFDHSQDAGKNEETLETWTNANICYQAGMILILRTLVYAIVPNSDFEPWLNIFAHVRLMLVLPVNPSLRGVFFLEIMGGAQSSAPP